MSFRVHVAAGLVSLTSAVLWAQQSGAPAASIAATPVAMQVPAQNQLVDVYCATCHSKSNKSGDLVLEGFNAGSPLVSAELLERMIRKVRSGQMPPANAERPEPAETLAFVEALEARADGITARLGDPGWRSFQRLNRAEYARVIKDLVGLDIDPSTILPPDTVSGGFDNIADVQTISPALMTAYLRGAASVSRAAIGAAAASPARKKVFTCTLRTRACAQTIVRALTAVAYRGAADDTDIADAMAFYDRGRERKDFDEGIRLALQSILVSPKFLFRVEPVNERHELSDLALASRLSFFLWSSGPDAALIAAAKNDALHTPEQLSAAARRMALAPKADALATRFAGQWLRLQDLEKSGADPVLAKAMRRETELFVSDLIRRDGRITELLTADRSFINERLAKHYGISNVRGDQFRVVTLPENRRGLLGQGSILTLTSLSTRTSPVLRGKWVLDVLLGTPPPPPPPNVPALDDSVKPDKGGTPLSTRQRVEEHRRNPSCSSCHRVIDPPGMTLENFDATGAWRAADNGVAIDAAADLYDGRRMDGAAGLRAALLAHEDMVVRNFTQQLMTYAVGRRLSYRDMPAVRAIVRSAAANGNRFSSFIAGVVSSDAFRLSRAPGESQK